MGQARKVPMRKCIGCQEMKNKKEMMRILKTTDEEVGRGAYICFSRECFAKAVKSRALERSLKMNIPQEVYESLKKEIDAIETE